LGAYSPLLCVEQAGIYHPSHASSESDSGGAEEVWFTASDGEKLHGRFFSCQQPQAVVLYCHGNAGSVDSWTRAAVELQERHQCAVFLFDYRGFGHSEGTPTEEGIYLDAQAARQWLARRMGIHPSDVVLMGRSLGGGVAVELAQDGARGLVLQSTFSSLPDVAASHVPWVFPHLTMTQRFDSIEKIKHYRGPLLQCHGNADNLVPLESAQRLFSAAPGVKCFVTIPGANHNDPPNQAFEEELDRFLSDLGRSAGGKE
jgi:fermentation-respiration switch protein FrsA (DUF1100 family)